MDDLDDEDDFEDEDEDEDEDWDDEADSVPDAFVLRGQCRDCAPNYPDWLKKDVVQYIEAYGSDLNRLSEFLGVHVGTLVIWNRKFRVRAVDSKLD